MKKQYLLAITFVIAGLMIATSATSISVKSKTGNYQLITEDVGAETLFAPCQVQQFITTDQSSRNTLLAGTQVTGGEFDEKHPSIAASPEGVMFLAFEGTQDGDAFYPFFLASEDKGQTWSDTAGYFAESIDCTYPSVDYKPTGFYGTFTPSYDTSGQIWLVDATDLSNIAGSVWDFGANGIDTFTDLQIATYTHEGPEGDPGVWNWGGIAFTGYNNYNGANIVDCPFVFYQTDEAGNGVIGWLTGNTAGCKHAAMDIDLVTNMSYDVYDRDNAGHNELLVRKDDFGRWTSQGSYFAHPLSTTKRVTATGNLTYPDVTAYNNNVLIVAETDEPGNHDIVCFYSMNGLNSFTPIMIANSAAEERYPQIQMLREKTAVCTYLKDGVVYYRHTEDGGVTWGDETKASDDEIDPVEYHAANINGINGDGYLVWQDGRGDNVDIYFDWFIDLPSPNVGIGTVSGGLGKVTMDVVNSGDGDASNISWSITVKGGILGMIDVTTTGTIDALAKDGGTESVRTDGFIIGLGSISIQLKADQVSQINDGTQFIIFTNVK